MQLCNRLLSTAVALHMFTRRVQRKLFSNTQSHPLQDQRVLCAPDRFSVVTLAVQLQRREAVLTRLQGVQQVRQVRMTFT